MVSTWTTPLFLPPIWSITVAGILQKAHVKTRDKNDIQICHLVMLMTTITIGYGLNVIHETMSQGNF